MAEAPPDAQHFLECDSCDVRPAKHHCSNCDGDLCDQCKDEHLRKKLSKNHSIVPISLSRKQKETNYGICITHQNKRYEFYCNDCKIPVCLICFKEKHFQHEFENIDTAFATRRQALLKNLREVGDVLIPKHESMLKNLKENYQRAEEKDNEIQDAMQEHTTNIVSTFQQHLQKSLMCVSENKKRNEKVFKESEGEMIGKIKNLEEIAQDLKNKTEPYKSESIGNIWSSNVRSLKDFQQQSSDVSFSTGKFTKGELSSQLISSQFGLYVAGKSFGNELCDMSNVDCSKFVGQSPNQGERRVELISTFLTLTSEVFYIDIVSPFAVWVSGENNDIILFDLHGNKLNTMKTQTKEACPSGLGVMKDKSVIYSDYLNKCIKRVTDDKQHQVFIRTDWEPLAIFVTFAGNVLVSTLLYSNIGNILQQGGICRYGQDGKLQLDIKGKDAEGNPLFSFPEDLCENVNGDICVSDEIKKRVTVVSMKGQLKFTYTGNKSPKFLPKGICTDSTGNILVASVNDNSVHMLNENGEFLAFLFTTEDGIENPIRMRFDSEGKLWLAERYNGKIKVFNYFNR